MYVGACIPALDDTIFLVFRVVCPKNISTDGYEIWRPHTGYHIERLGQARMIRRTLRIGVDFPINEEPILAMKNRQDMLSLLDQTRNMCEHAGRLATTTHCDVVFNIDQYCQEQGDHS